MAMENELFIVDVSIETPILSGFPVATFDYRRAEVPEFAAGEDLFRSPALQGLPEG